MSFIPIKKEDYARGRPKQTTKKNQTIVAKKVRFPTQHKTRRCSLCRMPATTTVKIGKEFRKLCRNHRNQHFRGKEKQGIIMELDFRTASGMLDGS